MRKLLMPARLFGVASAICDREIMQAKATAFYSRLHRVIDIRNRLLEKADSSRDEIDGQPGVWRRVGNSNVFFSDSGDSPVGMPTFDDGKPEVKPHGDDKASKYARRGAQLPDAVQAKLKELKVQNIPNANIPLADIQCNLDPEGIHDRAVISWREKGVVKHGYTPQFHERNAKRKWDRVRRFEDKVPGAVKKLSMVMRGEHGTIKHQGATIAMIIAKTGLRPGSSKSVDEQDRHGVSTLKKNHVTVEGGRVSIAFVGKTGKNNKATINSPIVARALKRYISESKGGFLFPAGDRATREARRMLPTGMKLKDFRTILGTQVAREALDSISMPSPTGEEKKDKRALSKALNRASDIVAERLNNTKDVTKGHYIHPEVFGQWIRDNGYSYLER